MANILNLPNCGGVAGTFNSGVDVCDIIRGIPYGLFLTDSGVEFNAGDMASIATFVAAMKLKTRAARGGRVYPLWNLVNFEDTTKEATRGALGNLAVSDIKLVSAIPGFKFGHYNGEIFHQKLSKAEREKMRLIITDQKFAAYGTQKSSGNFAGYTLNEFSVDPPKFATPSGAAEYPFNIVLASILEYKDNLGFIQADATLGNISGLIDVVITLTSQAANVIKVKVLTVGAQSDLYAIGYDDELNAVGAWAVQNLQTLAGMTITSVAKDAVGLGWTITVDNTQYTALTSGQKFGISLASASVLSATYLVDGYEGSNQLVITKP